jgi:hypothetical protein
MTTDERDRATEVAEDAGERIGIALSGGGVRAASLALGALQKADERDLLRRTTFVSAVSGGSYIASAFFAARASGKHEAWARGSDEERYLKRHLGYLLEDPGDVVVALVRYLLGATGNLLSISAVVALCGAAAGIMLRSVGLVRATAQPSAPHSLLRWSLGGLVILIAAVVETLNERRRGLHVLRRTLAGCGLLLFVPDVIALVWRIQNLARGNLSTDLLVAAGLGPLSLLAVARSQWPQFQSRRRALTRSAIRALFAIIWGFILLAPFAVVAQQSTNVWKVGRPTLGIACIVLVIGAYSFPANATSLSRLYEQRLLRAYVVSVEPPAGKHSRRRPKRLDQVRIDELDNPGLPELIICAAVNLRDKESAQGEGSASFTFSSRLVGSAAFSAPGYISSSEFAERPEYQQDSRLSTIVAVSGGAIAPNMGRYTRRSVRLALVLLNLRLGRWVLNPVHPTANEPRRNFGRAAATIRLAALREAMGGLSLRSHALFISDGGHWDNSGIVELLRRRCNTVFAVDAAADRDRLSNILRAIELARTELGVEFDAAADLLDSREAVVKIHYRFPADSPASLPGTLILMRSHMSDDMPSDLVALARSTGVFPRHSTMNQFMSARDCAAYVAMGRWLMGRALMLADLPAPHSSIRLPNDQLAATQLRRD